MSGGVIVTRTVPGPPGPTGPTGTTGATGPQGPKGDTGQSGAGISVASPTALRSVVNTGLVAGTLAYVQAPGRPWLLNPSDTTTPDDGISCVTALNGGRWYSGGTEQFYHHQTTWFQSLSAGNDTNDGLTQGTAIRTPRELVRRLGGVFGSGEVAVYPLGSSADDMPRLSQASPDSGVTNCGIWNILAYATAVRHLSGTNGEAWLIKSLGGIPNGAHLRWARGSRIVSTVGGQTGDGTVQVAPLAIPVLRATNINLHADVAAGATTFTTTDGALLSTTPGASGSSVQFLQNTGQPNQKNGLYFVKSPIPPPVAGVYTITVDRPILQSFSHTADTLAAVTFLPRDIFIEASGATLTGTGNWLFACSGVYNLRVEGLEMDTSGGQPGTGGGLVLIDTSSYQVTVRGCKAIGFTCGGGFFIAPCENVIVENCRVEYCNFASGGSPAAFFMLTCVNSKFVNCWADTCNNPGIVVDGASINVVLSNCTTLACGPNILINSGINTVVTGCQADYGPTGILVGSAAVATKVVACSATGNTGSGLLNNASQGLQVSNFSGTGNGTLVSGGGQGYTIDGVDVTGNATGINLGSNCAISRLTTRGGQSSLSYVLTTSTAGISVTVTGFDIINPQSNANLIGWNANSNLSMRGGRFTQVGNSGSFAIFNVGACVIHLEDIVFDGSGQGGCGAFEVSGGTIYIGQSVDVSRCLSGFTFFGTANFVFQDTTQQVTISASTYTLDSASNNRIDYLVRTSSASNAVTLTLPGPATNYKGRVIKWKDSDGSASTHSVTIVPTTPSTEKIDGATSLVESGARGHVELIGNGVGWDVAA